MFIVHERYRAFVAGHEAHLGAILEIGKRAVIRYLEQKSRLVLVGNRYDVVFVDEPSFSLVQVEVNFLGSIGHDFRQTAHYIGSHRMIDQAFLLGREDHSAVFRYAVHGYA